MKSRAVAGCGLLAVACLSGAAVAGPLCGAPVLALDGGVQRSHWEEFNAQGRSLLREDGTLQVLGLSLGSDCSGVRWSARVGHAQGTRSYQGVTTLDAPIQTASRIEQTLGQIEALSPVGRNCSLGGRLGYRRIARDIAGVGDVLGYPERFADWQAAAGLRCTVAQSPALMLTLETWLGAGPQGTLLLRLPQADPATLRIGGSRLVQLGAQVGGRLATPGLAARQDAWTWQARLDYVAERFAAGASQAIFRNGVLVGAAAQPATRQSALRLEGALQYHF